MGVIGGVIESGQPTSLPPSGAAGGDLGGTFPNPTVTDDSHSHTASTLPATIVYDGDAAGGDLGGTYPNPSVTDDSHAHTATTLPAVAVPLFAFLAADATSVTATMAALGLSVPVVLNRKYRFELSLLASDSEPADGIKLDFDASTAAATNFRARGVFVEDDGTTDLIVTTTLAGDFDKSLGADVEVTIRGSFEPSSSGNFAVRFAQSAHTTGTLTIYRGATLMAWDVT